MSENEQEKKKGLIPIIDEWVTTLVDQEVVALNNRPLSGGLVSKKMIEDTRTKHENKIFDLLKVELEKMCIQSVSFILYLQEDDNELYQKLTEALESKQFDAESFNTKLKQCKSKKDFEEIVVKPFTSEELQKVCDYGKKWFEQNEFEKAQAYFQYLIGMDPSNADYWLFKGMTEQALTNYEEAIICFTKIVDLKPDYLMSHLLIVDCLISNDQIQEAKEYFNQVLNIVSEDEYADDELFVSTINSLKETLMDVA